MKKTYPVTYLAVIAIVTVFSALIYVTVQQTYRSSANDPQLQLAGDMADHLEAGKSIERFMDKDTIELSKSLSVFTVLFDRNEMPVRSTALLNGKLPQLPKGVFDFAARNGENVFTWQPRNDVRVAMVVKAVKADTGFIGVGRSLSEVEKRESNLVTMIVTAWIIALAVILFHFLTVSFFKRLKEQG